MRMITRSCGNDDPAHAALALLQVADERLVELLPLTGDREDRLEPLRACSMKRTCSPEDHPDASGYGAEGVVGAPGHVLGAAVERGAARAGRPRHSLRPRRCPTRRPRCATKAFRSPGRSTSARRRRRTGRDTRPPSATARVSRQVEEGGGLVQLDHPGLAGALFHGRSGIRAAGHLGAIGASHRPSIEDPCARPSPASFSRWA